MRTSYLTLIFCFNTSAVNSRDKMDSNLLKVFKYIDKYQEHMLDDLRKIISFKSISGSLEHQNDMQEMIRWTETRLKSLKPSYCERFDIGSHTLNGITFKLPYVIFAAFGNDPKKKTVLIYCGVDVKAADPNDWTTNPWELVKNNRDLVGRGVYKGKSQFISWLHILEAFRKQDLDLPVNFKFLIEGMSQMNSIGLENLLWTERTRFLKGIDFICVNEMEWLNSTNPCIGFGCCGISQFELICTEARKDVKPCDVIDSIIKSISDDKGNILIPKFDDDVLRITPEIEQVIDSIECDLNLIKSKMPPYMHRWDKQKILLQLWQFPSLKVDDHFTDVSCTCGKAGDSPNGISKKLTFKIVHGQTPERCTSDLFDFIPAVVQSLFMDRRFAVDCKVTSKSLKCSITDKQSPVATIIVKSLMQNQTWQEDTDSAHFLATKRATKNVFKYPMNLIKHSSNIPIISQLSQIVRKSIVVMPLGDNRMDEKYSNERITETLYFEGRKLMASYIFEISKIKQ